MNTKMFAALYHPEEKPDRFLSVILKVFSQTLGKQYTHCGLRIRIEDDAGGVSDVLYEVTYGGVCSSDYDDRVADMLVPVEANIFDVFDKIDYLDALKVRTSWLALAEHFLYDYIVPGTCVGFVNYLVGTPKAVYVDDLWNGSTCETMSVQSVGGRATLFTALSMEQKKEDTVTYVTLALATAVAKAVVVTARLWHGLHAQLLGMRLRFMLR